MSVTQLAKPGQPVKETNLESFFPGYFALVMATGIVSIGLSLWQQVTLSRSLLYLNIIFYVVLCTIAVLRAIKYPRMVWNDLHHPARGVTFLTLVAGTNILGSQFAIILQRTDIALLFWITGFAIWAGMLYIFFLVNIIKEPKPTLEQSISGAWLLIVVSTESVAVLGSIIAMQPGISPIIPFISLCTYMVGGMFYLVLIGLIIYRWLFFSMKAAVLTPPYWINMGAVAIITLAGSRLISYTRTHPEPLFQWGGFLESFTLFFWAFATWWIPLLFILFTYRHLVARVPLQYDPQYWSMVFPLGMYGVSTFLYGKIAGFPFLQPVGIVFVAIATCTWVIVLVGLILTWITMLPKRTDTGQSPVSRT